MTDTERIARLEAEVAALRELVEHMAFRGPVSRGPDGKMIPVRGITMTNPNGIANYQPSYAGTCANCGLYFARQHTEGQGLCPACGERGK
jgi:rubrerythrin